MKSRFPLIIVLALTTFFTKVEAQTIPSWLYFDYTDTEGNQHNLQDYFNQQKSVFVFYFGDSPTSYQTYENLHLTDFYNTYGQGGNDDVVVLCVAEGGFDSVDEMSGLDYSDALGAGYENVSFTAGNPIPMILAPDPSDSLDTEWYGVLRMFCYDDHLKNFYSGDAETYMDALYEVCCTNLETFDPGLELGYSNYPECAPHLITYNLTNGSPFPFSSVDIDVWRNGNFETQYTVNQLVEGCSTESMTYENANFTSGDQITLAINNSNVVTSNDTLTTAIENVDTVSGRIRLELLDNTGPEVWGYLTTLNPPYNSAAVSASTDYRGELYLQEGCYRIDANSTINEDTETTSTMLITSIDAYGNTEDTLFLNTNTGGVTDTLNHYRGQIYVVNAADPMIWGYVFEDSGLQQVFDPSLQRIEGVEVTQGATSAFTNSEGYYEMPLSDPSTSISITYDTSVWPVITTPNPLIFSPDQTAFNFGLNSDDPVYALSVLFDPNFPIFCETSLIQQFKVFNTGNQPTEGELIVQYDPMLTPLSFTPQPSGVDGNMLTYSIPELPFSGAYPIEIVFNAASADLMGEILTTTLSLSYLDENDAFVLTDTLTSIDSLFCSYDPNDIYGFPLGTGEQGYIPANTPLKYRIRFQNTGNYPATNVVVVDTLPETLDLSTFEPIMASHPYSVSLNADTRVIKWIFPGINLPDSLSDPEGSMGTIWYSVAMNALDQGDEIKNRAAIYFDSNAPIYTNTSLHTIDGISGLTYVNPGMPLRIYPNPTAEILTVVQAEMNRGTLTVFDLSGRNCMQQTIHGSEVHLNVGNLEPGLYLLRLTHVNGNISAATFVKW